MNPYRPLYNEVPMKTEYTLDWDELEEAIYDYILAKKYVVPEIHNYTIHIKNDDGDEVRSASCVTFKFDD